MLSPGYLHQLFTIITRYYSTIIYHEINNNSSRLFTKFGYVESSRNEYEIEYKQIKVIE